MNGFGYERVMRIGLLLVATAVAFAHSAGAQDPITGSRPAVVAPNAWETSLALEGTNDLTRARSVLIEAFGERPVSYEVAVRLAWLSLRMLDSKEAVPLYRLARRLPGALPEATQGLISSLNMSGYQALDRGNYPAARAAWDEVLTLDHSNRSARSGKEIVGSVHGAALDIWYAALSSNVESSTAKAFYIGIPGRISNHISLRAAYRDIGGASANTDTTGLFGSQSEWYAGVSAEYGRVAAEVIGLSIHNYFGTSGGAALSARFGGRVGGSITISGIHQANGWNTQEVPRAFAWITPWLGLNAGMRFTRDSGVTETSPLVGTTLHTGRFTLDFEGHGGTSRLAFNPAGPTVLSFLTNSRSGGTVTLASQVRRDAVLFLQYEHEVIGQTESSNHYSGLAVGFRLITVANNQNCGRMIIQCPDLK